MRSVKRGHILLRKSRSWIRNWSPRYLSLTDEGILHVYKLTSSGRNLIATVDDDDDAGFLKLQISWDVGEHVDKRAARYSRHCDVTPMGLKDGKYTFLVNANAGSGEESGSLAHRSKILHGSGVQALTIASHSLLSLNYRNLTIGKKVAADFGPSVSGRNRRWNGQSSCKRAFPR